MNPLGLQDHAGDWRAPTWFSGNFTFLITEQNGSKPSDTWEGNTRILCHAEERSIAPQSFVWILTTDYIKPEVLLVKDPQKPDATFNFAARAYLAPFAHSFLTPSSPPSLLSYSTNFKVISPKPSPPCAFSQFWPSSTLPLSAVRQVWIQNGRPRESSCSRPRSV